MSSREDRTVENTSRRKLLKDSSAVAGLLLSMTGSRPANALVKGNAPPPKMKPASSGRPKCTNVDDCLAVAESRELEEKAKFIQESEPSKVTAGGTRYRDIQDGSGKAIVKDGDEVVLYYKVLKLGKRSYDGLSGEGTVIFSRGYGLEDDEDAPATKSFITNAGSFINIAALNDALLGMRVGQLRRFAVLPEKGWRRPTAACDGGPGGQGAGGDVKTDYVVVPTAQLVAEEACFDSSRQPFPASFAQQRRMAQRFDQSLIMEVQVIDISPGA